MKRIFKNLSIRKKIFGVCILVSIIPIQLLGLFFYSKIKNILVERERMAIRESLIQASLVLDTKIDEYTQIVNHICWNNTLKSGIKREYENRYDIIIFYAEDIEPLFSFIKALNSGVMQVTIYTDIQIEPRGVTLRTLKDIENTSWYESVKADYKNHWFISQKDETVFIATQLHGMPQKTTTVIKTIFQYDDMFSFLKKIYEKSYSVVVKDETEDVLFEFHTKDIENFDNKDLFVQEKINLENGWTINLSRPMKSILISIQGIVTLVIFMILMCSICVIIFSAILSAYIVKPIEKLTSDMWLIGHKVIDSSAYNDSEDEIGQLSIAFYQMVSRLDQLMEELVKERLLQKEYEVEILRAQIKPHFLYNSLSLINSKAILIDQKEIGQIARYLADFYRTMLNNGKNYISVKEELKNVKSYVAIQMEMHDRSFDVIYDVEEEIMDVIMINMLLQPIVENAILHGIDAKTSHGRGILKITGTKKKNTLIFRVSDNGPGIPDDILQELLTKNIGKGYGVYNVQQRIVLSYGNGYGLSYQSSLGNGTTVILTLAEKIMET